MPIDQTANFVRDNLAASVTAADTAFSVPDVSVFPDPANGEYNLVLFDETTNARPDQDPDAEIVRVTARNTNNDTLSVTRGSEGTAGASHPSGSALLLSFTSGVIADVAPNDQAVETFTTSVTTAGEALLADGTGGLQFGATNPSTSTVTTSTTTSANTIVLADASGGALTVTLPAPADGEAVTTKKIDSTANAVTIATPGAETIDGQASISITNQFAARETISDGTNYFII